MKCTILNLLFLAMASSTAADDRSPEQKALAYLAKEVPAWSKNNHCFSCHNNGDAARALMTASKDPKLAVDSRSLADTIAFLARPEKWNEHEADSPNKDARLARIQFTSAMALAFDAKLLSDRGPLIQASEKLAADQSDDGSWPIESDETLGSPATYGKALATSRARRTLFEVDAKRFARPIAKADHWMRDHPIRNTLDASALLMGLPNNDPANRKARKSGLDFLLKNQDKEGGWGPFGRSAPEPFDTAIALLALSEWTDRDEVREAIGRGRKSLIASQLADGSWPETTRPSGAESYAQRLSTAGWATLALLATRQ